MDALDEFFATWCEPEAWCEMCRDHPAIHIVLRDTEGKYGGIMSHVRIWNPTSQTRVPVCRQCCRDQMELLGQSVQHAQSLQGQQPFAPPEIPSRILLPPWIRHLLDYSRRFFNQGLLALRRPR